MSLIGDLGEVKIGDVLRVLADGRKTGLLRVGAASHEAVMHFQKGVLVHAASARLQGDDAVIDVFGWKEGQLAFLPEEKAAIPNVSRPVDVLILEGLRTGDALHRLQEAIPSDRVVFQMSAGPAEPAARCTLGATEWKVLRLLNGLHDVREITEASRLPRQEVLRILLDLAEPGFLERVEPVKTMRTQAQGLFGKEAAEVDVRYDGEWRKIVRFAEGVTRVEVRTLAGGVREVPVAFRPGLIRDIQLPRAVLTSLGLREGEDVFVRPAP
jgi:hypothetical protein